MTSTLAHNRGYDEKHPRLGSGLLLFLPRGGAVKFFDCKTCGGYGLWPGHFAPCPECKGWGVNVKRLYTAYALALLVTGALLSVVIYAFSF